LYRWRSRLKSLQNGSSLPYTLFNNAARDRDKGCKMNNDPQLTASSCAVEKTNTGLRLSFHFMNFGEYRDAQSFILGNPDLVINNSDPRKGGSIGGTKLVLDIENQFAKAAAERLAAFSLRRQPEYVNGSRQPFPSVAEAIKAALDHP